MIKPTPLALSLLVCLLHHVRAEDVTVTNTLNDGAGSLRDALQFANANAGTRVLFDIPSSDPNFADSVWTIRPLTPLPDLTRSTVVDGSSQPGDTNPDGPEIVINGALAGNFDSGFLIETRDCVIKGFVVQGFAINGITLSGNQVTGCSIVGCYIGTDHTGTTAVPNRSSGITIISGASGNTIGGDSVSERNVIAGNAQHGVIINGATNNQVIGNHIGVDRTGNVSLPNQIRGVWLGSPGNTVGSLTAESPNIIAGNGGDALYLDRLSDTTIIGNHIGLGADGSTSLPNGGLPIRILGPSQNITIGGPTPASRNLLAGSQDAAILVDEQCSEITIQGNYIGLDRTGTLARPNAHGIDLGSSRRNRIADNVISGNTGHGIVAGWALRRTSSGNLNNPNENVISGNMIGLDATGTTALPNAGTGIIIFHISWGNTIGGPNPADRNLISGNTQWGVLIGGTFADLGPQGSGRTAANQVFGNWIGLPQTGTAAVGNGWGGLAIQESTGNQIGGPQPGQRNVISGNTTQGIALFNTATANNRIQGNLIGLAPDGLSAVPNLALQDALWSGAGINLWNSAQHNLIGGTDPLTGNYIAGNAGSGITISGNANNTVIYGNTLGLLLDQSPAEMDASGSGSGPARANTIGSTLSATANTICHHADAAITLSDTTTTDNPILGNAIFANGQSASGNHVSIKLFSSDDTGPSHVETLDTDFGPNTLQNYPLLSSVTLTGDGVTIIGTLFTAPNETFRVEFFANETAHLSGYGEGQYFIGALPAITTDTLGRASFTETFPAFIPPGWTIAGTTTSSSLNTSEFSQAIIVLADDEDQDGMPRDYELAQGFDPATADGDQDADGDGLTNLSEMQLRTNPNTFTQPNVPTAHFPDPETVELQFDTIQGQRYRLNVSPGLGGTWMPLADHLIGTGEPLTLSDPGGTGQPRRFYQLVQLP